MKYTLLQLQDYTYKHLQQIAKSMNLPRNVTKKHLVKLIFTKSSGTEVDVKRVYRDILEERRLKRKLLNTDRVLRVKSSNTNKTPAIQNMSSENDQGNKYENCSINTESLSQNSNQAAIKHSDFVWEPVKDFASACSILKSLPEVTEENFEVKTIPMRNIHGETMHIKALALKVKPSQEDEPDHPIVESLPSDYNTTDIIDNEQNVETVIDEGQIDHSHSESVEPIENLVLDTQCNKSLYLHEEIIEVPGASPSTDRSELMVEDNSCLNGILENNTYLDDILMTPSMEENVQMFTSNEKFAELTINGPMEGEVYEQTHTISSNISEFYPFETGGNEQMCTTNSNTEDFNSSENKVLEQSVINNGHDTSPVSHESGDSIRDRRIAEIYHHLIDSSKEYDAGIVSETQNEIHTPETSDYIPNPEILEDIDIGNLIYEDICSIFK